MLTAAAEPLPVLVVHLAQLRALRVEELHHLGLPQIAQHVVVDKPRRLVLEQMRFDEPEEGLVHVQHVAEAPHRHLDQHVDKLVHLQGLRQALDLLAPGLHALGVLLGLDRKHVQLCRLGPRRALPHVAREAAGRRIPRRRHGLLPGLDRGFLHTRRAVGLVVGEPLRICPLEQALYLWLGEARVGVQHIELLQQRHELLGRHAYMFVVCRRETGVRQPRVESAEVASASEGVLVPCQPGRPAQNGHTREQMGEEACARTVSLVLGVRLVKQGEVALVSEQQLRQLLLLSLHVRRAVLPQQRLLAAAEVGLHQRHAQRPRGLLVRAHPTAVLLDQLDLPIQHKTSVSRDQRT